MNSQTKSRKFKFYLLWAVGLAFYSALSFLAPVTNNVYNLTAAARYEIQIGIILPIALIWLIAVYGAQAFKQYAASIRDSPDGIALNTLASGLVVLAFGSIVSSIITAGRNYLINDSFFKDYIHLSNTIQWVISLIAFYLIWKGSSSLLQTVKNIKTSKTLMGILLVVYVVLSGWYITAMLHNPYRLSTPDASKHASYYLHDVSLFVLVILPYLVIWLLGIFSIVNIVAYRIGVKGVIYRQALRFLTVGIIAVVWFSIFGQLLATAGDTFTGWNLQGILELIFGIVVLYSIGYIFIAMGARRLAKLEQV